MGEDINSSLQGRSNLAGGGTVTNNSRMNEFTDSSLEGANVHVNRRLETSRARRGQAMVMSQDFE